MKNTYLTFFLTLLSSVAFIYGQTTEVFDDFEGSSNIPAWVGDDCAVNPNFPNSNPTTNNPSATVLRYHDTGGQYANIRFEMPDNFDLAQANIFSLKIFVPSGGITGSQNQQVSLKLQNGTLAEPWSTQSEIIKSIVLDSWQTVTFDFANDNYINLDPGALPPTMRTDFNRVVIQVNGENNNDQVIAFIDDVQLTVGDDGDDYVYDQLVWSDEFNTDGPLDPTKWFAQTRLPQGDSWFNGEIQHYTDELDNAYVENGLLKIVAKRQNYTDQGVTKQFTSARLNSKFAFTYGRVEIRAKLPTGVGTWPALWTLGKNINENGAYWQTQGFGTTTWPACGEIDIMEHWGGNQDYVSSAIHTPSSFGGTVNYGGRVLPNASTEFHNYTAVWSPEKIVFSVDGVVHYTYEPDVQNNDTWPFDLEQYLIFNVAILPSIAPSFTESAMEIDYVRVYQEGTTSTQAIDQSQRSSAFPNPFTAELDITNELVDQGPAEVKLYDTRGVVVTERQINFTGGRAKIDQLQNLARGVYIIQYFVGENAFYHKVLKQ